MSPKTFSDGYLEEEINVARNKIKSATTDLTLLQNEKVYRKYQLWPEDRILFDSGTQGEIAVETYGGMFLKYRPIKKDGSLSKSLRYLYSTDKWEKA